MKVMIPMKPILLTTFSMILALSSAFPVEFIDSKPVANGGKVVLELIQNEGQVDYYQYSYRTQSGINRVFYQKVISVRRSDGSIQFQQNWIAKGIGDMRFNDERISLFLVDFYDCTVVTLDIDTSSPKMHEDIFHDEIGKAKLVGVDEMNITDSNISKVLKRDKDGIWRLEGIPYTNKLESKTHTVPLPPIPQVVDLKADSVGGNSPNEPSKKASVQQSPRQPTTAEPQQAILPKSENSSTVITIVLGLAGVLLVWMLIRQFVKK